MTGTLWIAGGDDNNKSNIMIRVDFELRSNMIEADVLFFFLNTASVSCRDKVLTVECKMWPLFDKCGLRLDQASPLGSSTNSLPQHREQAPVPRKFFTLNTKLRKKN